MRNNTCRNPHWFRNRVIYGVSAVIWLLGVPLDLYFFLANKTTDDRVFLILFLLSPFCVAVGAVHTQCQGVFFRAQSVGKLGRSTSPDESPLLTIRGSWGALANSRWESPGYLGTCTRPVLA